MAALCSRTFVQKMALIKLMLASPCDEKFPGQQIGRSGAVQFHPSSPDLTPLGSYLWGTLKDVVYRRKLTTSAVFREETETACAVIHVDTLVYVAQTVVRCNQKCLDADGNQSENLLQLQKTDVTCIHGYILSITILIHFFLS